MSTEVFHLSCRVGDATLSVRFIGLEDESQVLALHQAVFSSSATAHWFLWKYEQGQGHAVGAWHEGRLIAMCGGLPRRLRQGPDTVAGLQICDVMVDPAWRGILTRRGPFHMVCHELYSRLLGPEAPFQIGFGFPNERHLRLAVKSGLSWSGEVIEELSWPALPGPHRPRVLAWHARPLPLGEPAFDQLIQQAWDRMQRDAQSLGVLFGQRDAHHVRQRFVNRPDLRYTFATLREPVTLRPRGVLITSGGDHPAGPLRWVDWIGPPSLLPQAAHALRQWAGRTGHNTVWAWASPAVLRGLQGSGLRRCGPAARLGIPCASAVSETAVHQQHWWLMAGDTDFL